VDECRWGGGNRLTSISYSDGTPSVTYTYDNQAAGANAGNTRGRITEIKNTTAAGTVIAKQSFTYDAVGNIASITQSMTNGFSTTQNYGFSYGYNLAGALKSETYPDGRVVSTVYDVANRPTSVNGTLGATQTPYITTTVYWPFGTPYYYVRGNTVWHAATYNTRLQPGESYEAVNNSDFLFVSCPNWGFTPNNYGLYDLCPKTAGTTGTNDNGMLQSYTESHGSTESVK
jgi:hypothetical protein